MWIIEYNFSIVFWFYWWVVDFFLYHYFAKILRVGLKITLAIFVTRARHSVCNYALYLSTNIHGVLIVWINNIGSVLYRTYFETVLQINIIIHRSRTSFRRKTNYMKSEHFYSEKTALSYNKLFSDHYDNRK